MRLAAKELASVRTIGSWPTRSSKRSGRYFLASTLYGEAVGAALNSLTRKSKSLNEALSRRKKIDGGASQPSLDRPPPGGAGELNLYARLVADGPSASV